MKLRVKVCKLRDRRQLIAALIERTPAVRNVLLHGGIVGGFCLRQIFAAPHGSFRRLFHFGKVGVQFQIRDKFMQQHFPLCLVRVQCFLTLVPQKVIVPIRVIGIVGMIAFDMLNQPTVTVPKVLSSLVAVRFAVHYKINAERGLVVAGNILVGFIKGSKEFIRFGKGHGLTVPQFVTLAPNHRNGRLGGRVGFGKSSVMEEIALCADCFKRTVRNLTVGLHIRVDQRLQHSLYAVGKLGLLLRGQLIEHGCFLLGGLLCFALLLDFLQMPVNAVDNFRCGSADCFKRAFQFVKLPSAAPPGNIPKGIVRRIKPVVLADSIGDAFRLYLAGAAVGSVLLFLFRCV